MWQVNCVPVSLLSRADSISKKDIQSLCTSFAGHFVLLDCAIGFKSPRNNRKLFDALFTHSLLCTPHCLEKIYI